MQFAQSIRVLVVDYHAVISSALAEMLRGFQDFEVVGHAESSVGALGLCGMHQPDVVMIDIDFPGENSGIEAIRSLRASFPQTRIVVLTNLSEENSIQTALKEGAISYLLKNISAEELAHAIRSAHIGQPTLSPEVTKALIRTITTPLPPRRNLTNREYQVLELIALGRTNCEIAKELSISLSTVQFHVRNILSKLGVHNRIEAATLAVRERLNGNQSPLIVPYQ